MREWIALILGSLLAVNGLVMLAAPADWYGLVPGVIDTGPFNPHFVRDIGCAYIAAGAALAWLFGRPAAWPAALAGAGFLVLHGLVHLWDMAAGRESLHHLPGDLVAIYAAAALAMWLAWPRRPIAEGDE